MSCKGIERRATIFGACLGVAQMRLALGSPLPVWGTMAASHMADVFDADET